SQRNLWPLIGIERDTVPPTRPEGVPMAAAPRRRAMSVAGFRRTAGVAGIALLIVLGLTGCAADAGSTAENAPAEAPVPGMVEGGGADDDEGGGTDAAGPAPVRERALIYTGSITVQVESVATAADEAIAVVVGLGGVVAGDNRTIDNEQSHATLTF